MTKKRGFFITVCVALAFLASAVFGSFAQPAFVLGKDNVTVFYAQTLSGGGSGMDYYGRSALSDLSRGTVYTFVYDKLVTGIANSTETIDIYNGHDEITQDELTMVLDACRRDHPEFFWLGNTYYINPSIRTVKLTYTLEGVQLDNAKSAFNQKVEQMLGGLASGMTDFEKELYLHDQLALGVVYQESDHAHDAYGALVEGVAVCEGYAEALQYLLQRAGIQSFLAIGSSVNPSTNTSEGHAWNYVKLDGKYYHVDLTWNDQASFTYHAYFNVTDDIVDVDHDIAPTEYALPQCDSMDKNYFEIKGGAYDSYTVDQVAQRLEDNDLSASFYITSGKDEFITWFNTNRNSIISKLGIVGMVMCGYSFLGNEVIVTIDTCLHNHVTPVTPVGATCTTDGNSAYYICTCGKWFWDADANSEIYNKNAVKVSATGHSYTQKIMDEAHKKQSATDCQHFDTYWYDCADCDANAKDDAKAGDKWYESTTAGDHTMSTDWLHKDSDGHAKTCTVPGCTHKDTVVPHTPGAQATEDTPQICTDCGYIITPALNHTTHTPASDWQKDNTHHWHNCTGCEGQQLDKASHVDDDDNQKCDVCNAEMKKAEGNVEIMTYVSFGAIGLGVLVAIFAVVKFLFRK